MACTLSNEIPNGSDEKKWNEAIDITFNLIARKEKLSNPSSINLPGRCR
jgi:hypothetical protein